MPRARLNHKLVRVPIPAELAFELTYYYDPQKDADLIRKHAPVMLKSQGPASQGMAKGFLNALEKDIMLTPKQRLCLLEREFPSDIRLKAFRVAFNTPDKRFEAKFRADPQAAYDAESAAIARAIRARMDEDRALKVLEEVLDRDY
jgi:hypothetical protein